MAIPRLPMPSAEPAVRPPPYFSTAMVDALNEAAPRGIVYETVYGELFVVNPARPWHAVLVDRLGFALRQYAEREPAAGYVSTQQARITFGRGDVNVSPDVWAARVEEFRTLDWNRVGGLLLAAEVLSPRTRRRDRFAKRRLYQAEGVPLYWVVDGDQRRVEVWTPDLDFPRVETERLAWHPEGASAPFALALAELFAPL